MESEQKFLTLIMKLENMVLNLNGKNILYKPITNELVKDRDEFHRRTLSDIAVLHHDKVLYNRGKKYHNHVSNFCSKLCTYKDTLHKQYVENDLENRLFNIDDLEDEFNEMKQYIYDKSKKMYYLVGRLMSLQKLCSNMSDYKAQNHYDSKLTLAYDEDKGWFIGETTIPKYPE